MHTESNKNTKYDKVLLQRLRKVVTDLVDAFEPEEIIMYGSYARGDNDIYSDIDIIIIADTDLRFQDRSLRALDIVGDSNDIPVNPIVYTPVEFKAMLERKESFLISALNESLLLWKKCFGDALDTQLETHEIESDYLKYVKE
ncbi:MAG: nucleotidyltransferase domain-containing protein [bacterium]